ncbi:MAG: hypothetical protein R3F34_21035, partial [Planctomycetota bacterium]
MIAPTVALALALTCRPLHAAAPPPTPTPVAQQDAEADVAAGIENVWALLEERKVAEALDATKRLAEQFPSSGRAHGIRAFVLAATQQSDESERELRRAFDCDEYAPEAGMLKANQLANAQKIGEAETLVRKARENHPESAVLDQLLGDIVTAGRDFESALDIYLVGLGHATSDRERLALLVKTGQAATQLGKYDVMETAMTRAMELKDDLRFWFTRADARAKQAKFDAALEDTATLLRRDDVRTTPQLAGQITALREAILRDYTAKEGTITPLVWALR